MSKRKQQTLADYVVLAISPALIMALVGSLMFFLLTISFQHEFESRLQWILFWWVFGMVLVSRLSIQEGGERAAVYGAALAGAVALVTLKFVGFAPLVWIIMAFIWWCTHRITWDCTLIDDSQDASGEGLLQVAGLDATGNEAGSAATAASTATVNKKSASPPTPWWNRLFPSDSDTEKRPHAPGVWVVYFSLAALPLFGMGQILIPATDVERRRSAFWLLAIYVMAGLGLLLTTSFLGLRRYLRQKKLEMPPAMTGSWLGIGAALVLAIVIAGALLPRPSPEYPLSEMIDRVAAKANASRWSVLKDAPAEGTSSSSAPAQPGQSPAGSQPGGNSPSGTSSGPGGQQPGQGQRGQSPQGSSQQNQSQQGQSQQGQAQQGQSQQPGQQGQSPMPPNNASQNATPPPSKPDTNSQNSPSDPNKNSSPPPNAPPAGTQPAQSDSAAKNSTAPQSPPAGNPAGNPAGSTPPTTPPPSASTTDSTQNAPAQSEASQAPEPPQPTEQNKGESWFSRLLSQLTGSLGGLMKWLFYGVLWLVVAFLLWKYRVLVLAALRDFWQGVLDLWHNLFGGKRKSVTEAEQVVPIKRRRPFSQYPDPFLNGTATDHRPDELVFYTFEAFDAWAFDHGWGRASGETPLEFAARLSGLEKQIDEESRELASLVTRVAFSRGTLTPAVLDTLRRVWHKMAALRPAANAVN